MVASNKVRRRKPGKRRPRIAKKIKKAKRRRKVVRKHRKRAPRRRKPGPKSFRELSVKPPKLGYNATLAWMHNQTLSGSALNAYRAGYKTMWDFCEEDMLRWKMKKIGDFDKKNQHGGQLWALRRSAT